MSTKKHNLSPLVAHIMSIVETSGDCTRKDIAVRLGRKHSRLLSNDIAALNKLIALRLVEAEEYSQQDCFKPLYVYRKVK